MLDEQDKIAKVRFENAKTLHDNVQKDAKSLRQVNKDGQERFSAI